MQDYELDAYLGDTDVTDEQRDRIRDAADTIAARYPDDDQATQEAFAAAVQVILGDDTTDAFAERWVAARGAERRAMEALAGALIADERGDATITRELGLNRMTVRKARGK